MNKVRNIYMYSVCFICVVVILMSVYSIFSSFSRSIFQGSWDEMNLIYTYQDLLKSTLMLLFSLMVFFFHWRKIENEK